MSDAIERARAAVTTGTHGTSALPTITASPRYADAVGMADVALGIPDADSRQLRSCVNQVAGAAGLPWKARAAFMRRVDPAGDDGRDTAERRARLRQALTDIRDRLRRG